MTRPVAQPTAALLEGLLTEAIAEADGPDAVALIASVQSGEASLKDLSAQQAEFVARALTCRSLLLSIAEDAAGRRRGAEAEAMDTTDPLRSLHAAVQAVRAAGGPTPRKALDGLDVTPVFTAHPTEVRRRAVVELSLIHI